MSSAKKKIGVGIIGGGLMGREAASAFGRWYALTDSSVQPELRAVADLNPDVLRWFEQVPSVETLTSDYQELLTNDTIDVLYVALPHHLHAPVYLDVLRSGKDLFAEKPFGIDREAAEEICTAITAHGNFVRCSSEFPFMPGAQRLLAEVASGRLGRVLEINAGFHHSSDMNPDKPVNWKRQQKSCGQIGVMGDLGMHVAHLPLRLGWKPLRVSAFLQRVYEQRPDGKGGMAASDTYDNALLQCVTEIAGVEVPMRWEMKRLAPGATNSWFIEVLGTQGGARYNTADPKAFWTFHNGKEQQWARTDLGFSSVFKAITGGIFEAGFPDIFMQMWAAYLEERNGTLGERFAAASPEEARQSHCVFEAALRAHERQSLETIAYEPSSVLS